MAEYRFTKRQTSRCDMNDKKFSTHNYQIISKTGKTQNFYVSALFVSAESYEHKAFLLTNIQKEKKSKWSTYYVTP